MITETRQQVIHDQVNREIKNKIITPEVKIMYVTPAMAEKWLESNTRNRRVRPSTVAAYTSDMLKRQWHLTGDAIAFDKSKVLINGQHRLMALVKSGTTQQFFVAFGLDPQAFLHTDIPVKRALADHIQLAGYKSANVHAALASRLAFYAKGGRLTGGIVGGSSSNPGLRSYADHTERFHLATNYTPLSEAVHFALNAYNASSTRLMSTTHIGLIYALYKPWHNEIDDFLTRVLRGLGFTDDDPAYALRRKLERNVMANKNDRWKPEIGVGYAVLAANADFQNKPMTKLSWNTKLFPQPLKQIAAEICAEINWPAPTKEQT